VRNFAAHIERDRKLFWEPRRAAVNASSVGAVQMKKFQGEALEQLDTYLAELKKHKQQSDNAQAALKAMEGMEDLVREAADFPKKTWAGLKTSGKLPPAFADQPHSSRFDGARRAIPNVCLKIPYWRRQDACWPPPA
jgi:type III restriction enzyme